MLASNAIYYVNRVLKDFEKNNSWVEKVMDSLVVMATKL